MARDGEVKEMQHFDHHGEVPGTQLLRHTVMERCIVHGNVEPGIRGT